MYLATIALLAVVSLTGAHGQDKRDAGGLKIANVNPGRLLNEYKFTKSADLELKKKQADIVTEMNSWDQHRLLSEADQRALGVIAVKDSNHEVLIPQDKTNKTKYEDSSKKLFDEYLALQTRQGATPAETDRLKELSRLETDNNKRIKDRQASAQEELQKQANDMRSKMDGDVRAAISKISKSKSLNVVFSSELALYCDNDITDDVLKELNK